MDDIQGTVGVSFFNNAGDIDFTCTCEGGRIPPSQVQVKSISPALLKNETPTVP
jgi:hypothetical protein